MSNTTRLGLLKPAPSDSVDVVSQLDNNFDVIDGAVGTILCTDVTRPNAPFLGQTIRETNTGLSYICSDPGAPPSTPPTWTLTSRGISLVTSTTRPGASNAYPGMLIYETDTNLVYIATSIASNVVTWTLYPRGCIVCTSITRPTSPVVGTLIYETDSSDFVICLDPSGPIWVTLERGYVYGGRDIVHSAALTATGNNNTEVLINNMTAGPMDLLPNSRYRLHARWNAVPSGAIGTTMATVTSFMLRIRDTNVSGAIRASRRVEVLTTVAGTVLSGDFVGFYETGVAESGKVWVMTAQRITTVAGPILTFQGAGATERLGLEVFNEGHSGQLTQVTS